MFSTTIVCVRGKEDPGLFVRDSREDKSDNRKEKKQPICQLNMALVSSRSLISARLNAHATRRTSLIQTDFFNILDQCKSHFILILLLINTRTGILNDSEDEDLIVSQTMCKSVVSRFKYNVAFLIYSVLFVFNTIFRLSG